MKPEPDAPGIGCVIGVTGLILGAAFWVALLVVAGHFIGKYW